MRTRLPSIRTPPPRTRSAPKIARTSSLRPDPTKPAIPSTSPYRSSKQTLCTLGPLTNVATALIGIGDVWIVGRLGDAASQGAVDIGARIFAVLFTVMNFLKTWLNGHILGAEKKYRPYLQQGRNESRLTSKEQQTSEDRAR